MGLAQTFIFSTPVFIVAGLVLLDIFRGRIGWSGFFYLIAAVGSAAVVAKVLVPASSCLSPPALAAGLSFGVASAVATLCLKYLGDRGEPTLRSVFYFGVGCCLVGSLGLAAGNPADIWRMATTPVLWLLALSTAVCQLTKVYSWGHYSPWLNSMLLFLGIPTALLMGWLFYDEELTEAELWLIAFVAGMTLSCAWCRSWWRRMTRSR